MWKICWRRLRVRELSFDRETAEYFHPGRSARALMDGAVVAQFGQIVET
jgi:phenylalanyl-tRNA synthetase beta subunit